MVPINAVIADLPRTTDGLKCEVFPQRWCRNPTCHCSPRTDCHFYSVWDTHVVKDYSSSFHMPNGYFLVWGNVSFLRKWVLIHLKYFLTNSKCGYQNNRMNHWRNVPSRQENAYNSCDQSSFSEEVPEYMLI